MSIATKYMYKYRGLADFHHVVDILVNQRLHAAPFAGHNDPMEGCRLLAHFNSPQQDPAHWNPLVCAQSDVKICSLSRSLTNPALWALYAEARCGICFKVSLKSTKSVPVVYQPLDAKLLGTVFEERNRASYEYNDFRRGNMESLTSEQVDEQKQVVLKAAERLFTRKDACWAHEEEERVFPLAGDFFPVDVHEVIFGTKTEQHYVDLINDVVQLVNATSGRTIVSRKMERNPFNVNSEVYIHELYVELRTEDTWFTLLFI